MSPDRIATFARTRLRDMVRRVPLLVRHSGTLLVAFVLFSPIDASAQYGRTFRTTVKLTSSDLVIIRKIVREDFTGKPNGTTRTWSNPESQNSGTVTLVDRFDSQGRDCRRVRYLVKPGPQQPPSVISSTYLMTTCRLPDGTWRLDNQAQSDSPH